MITFFSDIREINNFDFEVEKKVRVTGKLSEKWKQLLSRSIACGEDKKRIIEKKIGISKTEREDLESLIKGSIGLKGIAAIESQIKASTGIEVKFEYTTTETEETNFKAPDCGRKTLIVYQLVREYDLTITDKRFFSFSKGQTRIILTEYTDNFHDKSLTNDNDPDCGCKEKPADPDDGILALLINKNYQLITPYKIVQQNVHLKNLDMDVAMEELGRIALGNFQIDSFLLPDYIQFIADAKTEQVDISLNTNGNIAFDYEEKIKFNQDLNYSSTGDVLKGIAIGAVLSESSPIHPYDQLKGIDPGNDIIVIPGVVTEIKRRLFGQEGEGQVNK